LNRPAAIPRRSIELKRKNYICRLQFPKPAAKLNVDRDKALFSGPEVSMRIVRFVSILAGSALALAAPSLPAQITSGFAGRGEGGVARQPYTLTTTEKSVQTLANGATITRESTNRVARDSAGRTYSEQHHAIPAGPDGQPRETVFYFVNDPTERTSLTWSSQGKEATLTHHSEPQVQRTAPSVPEVRSDVAPTVTVAPQPRVRPQTEVQREELGTKTIAGVNAVGVRTTRVIPAGREGNDQPLTITDETWRSPEYGVILLSIHDDPRNGTSTREATEFLPGEPDPALFKVPEGYVVKEIMPQRTTVAVQ
jgi:hypothetical protein